MLLSRLYSTLLPQAGRQLELCWRTSWDSHPSEDLSELPKQKYHCRLTGSWRDSLPVLSWPEWVSLCTLFGRPSMRNAPHRWSSRTRPDAPPSANVFKLPDVTAHGGVFQGSMRCFDLTRIVTLCVLFQQKQDGKFAYPKWKVFREMILIQTGG